MIFNEFSLHIENNNFVAETEDDDRNMNCKFYINFDPNYNKIYEYLKENGKINILVGSSLEGIFIETSEKKYSFEDYMLDGEMSEFEDIEGIEFGRQCYEFYCYYFYD